MTAVLDAVDHDLSRPGFRGCPFGNAAVDYHQETHPARQIARDYREQLRARLLLLAQRLTGEPQRGRQLGDQLAALIEGAYLNAAHLGPHGPARSALALARQLIGHQSGPH